MQITLANAPVFHSHSLNELFDGEMQLDDQGLFRPLELILFEGTQVEVLGEEEDFFEVRICHYPSQVPLYVPKIFIGRGAPKKRVMPTREQLLERLYSKLGLPYIWGGNCSAGIPEMLTLFPPKNLLTEEEEARWTFRGLDCSGLLYEATDGLVPRNTASMMEFGEPVTGDLEPLDLILFKGHVLFVAEEGKVIESHLADGGVVLHNLKERLDAIQEPLSFRRFSKILRNSSLSKSLS
ncbi:MAG: hypothetical protein SNF33_03935 [Candidatus Algichlamydia australiensis]|nr:hypothetical protein [Chlamydiales bacterium]